MTHPNDYVIKVGHLNEPIKIHKFIVQWYKLKFWTSCDTNFIQWGTPTWESSNEIAWFFLKNLYYTVVKELKITKLNFKNFNMPQPTKRKAAHKKVNRNEQGKFTKEVEIPWVIQKWTH